MEQISQLQPGLIVVDAESDARNGRKHVVCATPDAPRPIVWLTNDQDTRQGLVKPHLK
jgi:response regulator NasT